MRLVRPLRQASKFLHASPAHLVLGLQMLQQLVAEMNSSSNTRSLAQHRKVSKVPVLDRTGRTPLTRVLGRWHVRGRSPPLIAPPTPSRGVALCCMQVAGSFRDGCLYSIFKVGQETLQQLQAQAIHATEQVGARHPSHRVPWPRSLRPFAELTPPPHKYAHALALCAPPSA